MEKEFSKILKVVYFDEESAIGYIEMKCGGIFQEKEAETKEEKRSATAGISGGIKASVGFFDKLKAVAKIDSEIKGDVNVKKIITTSLNNTILTEFIKIAEKDDRLAKFSKTITKVNEKSLTYLKIFSPYLTMMKESDGEFDAAKADEALRNGKGYYEMLVDNDKVLRFNINAFKNSYGLIDLTKMRMKYICVKVGACNYSDLDVQNEFKIKHTSSPNVESVVLGEINRDEDKKLEVFDVFFGGVECDE